MEFSEGFKSGLICGYRKHEPCFPTTNTIYRKMNVRMLPIVQYKLNQSATSARHSLSGIIVETSLRCVSSMGITQVMLKNKSEWHSVCETHQSGVSTGVGGISIWRWHNADIHIRVIEMFQQNAALVRMLHVSVRLWYAQICYFLIFAIVNQATDQFVTSPK